MTLHPIHRRRLLQSAASALGVALLGAAPWARAADEAPEVLIKRLSDEVLDMIRADNIRHLHPHIGKGEYGFRAIRAKRADMIMHEAGEINLGPANT